MSIHIQRKRPKLVEIYQPANKPVPIEEYDDFSIIDAANSTTTPLGISGVFTGSWTDVLKYSQVTCLLSTDTISTETGLQLQFSTDGVNIDRQKTVPVLPTGAVHTLVHIARYFRIVYNNGPDAQSYLRLQTIHHKYKNKNLTSTASQVVSDRNDVQLVRSITDTKLDINRNIISDKYTVHKFGANPAVGTSAEDIWEAGGAYNWLTGAATIRVRAGGSVNDTAAGTHAQVIIVEGLDADWNPQTVEITLAGASASASTTETFIRATRAYVKDVGTYGGTNEANILIETSGGVLIIEIAASLGQSEISMFSVPLSYNAYLTRVNTEVDGTKIAHVNMWRRNNGDDATFTPFSPARIVGQWVVTGSVTTTYDSYVSFPEKTDIWFSGHMVSGNSEIDVQYDLILVKNHH